MSSRFLLLSLWRSLCKCYAACIGSWLERISSFKQMPPASFPFFPFVLQQTTDSLIWFWSRFKISVSRCTHFIQATLHFNMCKWVKKLYLNFMDGILQKLAPHRDTTLVVLLTPALLAQTLRLEAGKRPVVRDGHRHGWLARTERR